MTTAIEERGDGPNLPEQKRAQVVIPPETLAAFGGDELRARVFYEKYALRDVSGKQIERTPSQMWHRVASELASVEKEEGSRREWASKFYWLLEDFRFVPGGRILFGAGQPRNATLLNCYFFGIREDSIEAIFDFCKEAARTYSYGGGVGTDISVLRPKGSPVNNAAIFSSGAVSFMELLSTTTGTIGQAGRRGAQMITIRVDHPDVIDFINVKKDLKKVNYANISVKITDAFMRAVERDDDFELKFKNEKVELNRKVRAREIWKQLVKGAWESDEPGVIFWDTIKRESTTEYNQMEVEGVNPCSEQTLENYGNCCLGSVNLSAFVHEPFTDHSNVDWDSLVRATQYAVRFLDNVLDYNADRHPLPQQRKASLWSRRIGVGITGLGDMLIKLGLKYDEDATIEFVDKLFEKITNVIYEYSTQLAKEKGSFPAFEAEKHLAQAFIQRLDPIVKERVKMQATIQRHIDTAISSTVNLPESITPEEVERIYFLAWELGCKGITVYREGSREGILETEEAGKKKEVKKKKEPLQFERPKVMSGRTLKLRLPQGSLYVTANSEGEAMEEVFVNIGKLGGDEKADAEAMGRLISLYLQHGGDIQNVIRTLKGIRGKYVSWDDGVQLLSIPDATAKALEMLVANGATVEPSQQAVQGAATASAAACPECKENTLIFENG